MKYDKIDCDFFVQNRKRLFRLLDKGSLVIVTSNDPVIRAGNQYYPFKQNPNLFYLTGINQQNSVFLMSKDYSGECDEILFISEPDSKRELWEGRSLLKEEAMDISGVSAVLFSSELPNRMLDLIEGKYYVLVNLGLNSNYNIQLNEFFNSWSELSNGEEFHVLDLSPYMTKLRLIKSPLEIELMKRAGEITKSAFINLLKTLKSKKREFEIEAEIIYEFTKSGANGHAFNPIIASGSNALILHYNDNRSICKHGDLVLIDFGAEYANYCADYSRTLPLNGRFNSEQKKYYELVHRLYKAGLKLIKPGTTINIINQKFGEIVESEFLEALLLSETDIKQQAADFPAYKKYFMHGLSHFIGLEVHDVGSKDEVLKKGMILSCEPGVYIPELGIGIRIENDILVADKPIELVKDFPVEWSQIEELINT